MTKKTIISTAFCLAVSATQANAQSEFSIQGQTYSVDTIAHYKAGPAMTYTKLKCTAPSHLFEAFVVTVDMNDDNAPQLKVEVGKDSCNTAEAIPTLARRKSDDTRRYVSGINGDFFITSSFQSQWENKLILGYPNNTSATLGQMISPDVIDAVSKENAFVLTTDGNMYIDHLDYGKEPSGSAACAGTFTYPGKLNPIAIQEINFVRADNQIILYNQYAGKYTCTSAGGCEVAVELAEGESWGLNRPIKTKIVATAYTEGNMAIPTGGAVISAGNKKKSAIQYLNKYKIGDEVIIQIDRTLPAYGNMAPENISEIIGGDVRILNEGVTTTDAIRWINGKNTKNPRSMIGYSQDRSKFVMCAVDGRNKGVSEGVTYLQAADLMRELGCFDALHFDGGGSTLMYLRTPGVVNRPSDGYNRPVGNGIFTVVNAPASDKITEIRFADHAVKLTKGVSYTPVIYGYNCNGELISMNVSDFSLSCPDALGTIKGTTLTATGSGTHALTATKDGMKATVAVHMPGGSGGIDDISAGNSDYPVEYFDLFGRKIDNPSNGIYLKRQGTEVSKILIK